MRAAVEERSPIALGSETRAPTVGVPPLFFDATLLDTIRRALLVFLPLALLTTLVFYFVYHVTTTANRHVLETGQEKLVQMGQTSINASLNGLASDILFLGNDGALRDWLENGDPALRTRLAEQYLAFATFKRQYDQVRFIDAAGQEKLRIERSDGRPRIVPADALQDKSDQPYFAETINLAAGEIYVSPLDLNVEHGIVEQPSKPTLRVATPVFDSTGRKRGIVILNYLAERILNRIRGLAPRPRADMWLVNSDSYWLVGPGTQSEFGFMLADRADRSFARAYPGAWKTIDRAAGFGQLNEGDGLFSYAPLYAPATAEEGVRIATAPLWYLIAHVPTDVETAQSGDGGLAHDLSIALGGAFALLAGTALLIGHHGAQRKLAEKEAVQLNIRLAQDNNTLQMLNRELEAFSYSVSHDLRGPLRAIDGFSNALLEDASESLDETGRQHLTRIRNAAQRMGELIDDLLTLSQVGRAELSLVDDVDLSETACAVVENLRRLDPHRDVEFAWEPAVRALRSTHAAHRA